MHTLGSAIFVMLAAVMLNACDRGKPGNPMPPQKPPMPKTQADTPLKKPAHEPVGNPAIRRA